jgi:post-segregation antitoxin (ccd killing protein)
MATATVSYTLDADLPEQVKTAARRAGLSTSAYVSRALRRAVLRDAARRYAEWLEADAAVRDEIAAFRSLGDPAVSLAEMDAAL